MKYKKAALFTDIHFGRKNNSVPHNEDCIKYIDWLCNHIKNDPSIDHVIFLGDWHESRNSISGLTLSYSILGAEKLNNLNLPVYMIVGNHDIFYRNERKIYTPIIFKGFNNFRLISEISQFDELNDVLFVPYLFESEYPKILEYKSSIIFSHLEFKGFVMTGEYNLSEHGIAENFLTTQKRIFCGHFHKRQNKKNIFYIGNTFQMDFSDSNDFSKGFATYEYGNDELKFIDYENGPHYIKEKMSVLLEKLEINPKKALLKDSYVIIEDDYEMAFGDLMTLQQSLTNTFKLRSLKIEVPPIEFKFDENDDDSIEDTDEIIKNAIKNDISSSDIDVDILLKIYNRTTL